MSFSDWFLPSGAQTSAEAEANYARQQRELEESIARRKAEGTLSQAQEDFYRANTGPLDSQNAAYIEGLQEGAQEGLQNVLQAPGKAVGAVTDGAGTLLGGVLKNIPLWLWVAAAVVAFFYLGGGILLRNRLAKL